MTTKKDDKIMQKRKNKPQPVTKSDQKAHYFLLDTRYRWLLYGRSRHIYQSWENGDNAWWYVPLGLLCSYLIAVEPITYLSGRITFSPYDVTAWISFIMQHTDQVAGVMMGFFCILLAGITLVEYINETRWRWRLRRHGILLEGVVTQSQWVRKRRRRGHHPLILVVYYRATTPDGRTITGRRAKQRPDLQGNALGRKRYYPPVGTPVHVLYVDDNCYVML